MYRERVVIRRPLYRYEFKGMGDKILTPLGEASLQWFEIIFFFFFLSLHGDSIFRKRYCLLFSTILLFHQKCI